MLVCWVMADKGLYDADIHVVTGSIFLFQILKTQLYNNNDPLQSP